MLAGGEWDHGLVLVPPGSVSPGNLMDHGLVVSALGNCVLLIVLSLLLKETTKGSWELCPPWRVSFHFLDGPCHP